MQWQRCVKLYPKATRKARYFGTIDLTRRQPLRCHLHLLKKTPKGRHEKTPSGRRAARKSTQDHIRRESQPWLIVTSLNPHNYNTKQVMQLYRTRMQIELGFRDIKNTRDGLALRETRSTSTLRLANLLLVGMLAHFCLWLIGRLAVASGAHYQLQANTERTRPVLSVFFIGRQLVSHNRLPKGARCYQRAIALVKEDIALQPLT